jgi:solute carrier family 44 (choline transporter-like protein), member 2/4/5
MESASEFVAQNLRIVFLPLISYVWVMLFFLYWIYTAVYLYSIGEPEFRKNSPVANIVWDQQTWGMMWYFMFGLFWCVAYFICLQQFIIAAMVCMWYFSGQGSEMSDQPGEVSMIKAIGWGTYYHLGSIAFGSFLIAVITMIRVVFEYIVKKYESVANKENPIYKAVTCCVRCILWCLDKYVKFITKNAYIQIALHNSNFCKAAWESFFLIVRHAGRFGSASVIGWIMMMLGKGTIMATSAYLTILIVERGFPMVLQPFVPAILVACIAYVVGSLFLSIFSFACTAILHCFLADEDTGGSANTPDSLRAFLDFNDEANAKAATSKKEAETEKKPEE